MKPVDKKLYEKSKTEIYKKMPKHSAYRSGHVVKLYKKKFKEKYGNKKPYKGNKKNSSLGRWFQEKWTNQRGNIGYKSKSDVYRPTIRISNKTPKTFSELSSKQIKKARESKLKKGKASFKK